MNLVAVEPILTAVDGIKHIHLANQSNKMQIHSINHSTRIDGNVEGCSDVCSCHKFQN
jgi:hypothetical protein